MSVSRQQFDDKIWIVNPRGRMDQSLNLKVEEALIELLDSGQQCFIVNLGEVTYINSGGLRCLVAAWRRSREQGGDLVLCELNSRLEEIFSLVGFDRVFQIYASYDEAQKHSFP